MRVLGQGGWMGGVSVIVRSVTLIDSTRRLGEG